MTEDNLCNDGEIITMIPTTNDKPFPDEVLDIEKPKTKSGRPRGSKNKQPRKKVASRRPVEVDTAIWENKPTLGYYKVHDDVIDPVFGTRGAACFDVSTYIDPEISIKGFSATNRPIERAPRQNIRGIIINPFERLLIPTGLILDIPEGWSVRVHPRSSVGYKFGFMLPNGEGIVDWDYTEQFYIMIINATNIRQLIEHGQRIAQCELLPAYTQDRMTLKKIDVQPKKKTDRSGGFGSTGG